MQVIDAIGQVCDIKFYLVATTFGFSLSRQIALSVVQADIVIFFLF